MTRLAQAFIRLVVGAVFNPGVAAQTIGTMEARPDRTLIVPFENARPDDTTF